jgi:hypothetical protein
VAAKAGTAQPWLAQAAADLAAQSGAVVDVVSAVNIGVIILRRTRPDLERGYRVPFVPVVPIIGTLLCIYLMVDLPGATWARFVIWGGNRPRHLLPLRKQELAAAPRRGHKPGGRAPGLAVDARTTSSGGAPMNGCAGSPEIAASSAAAAASPNCA